MIRSQFRSRPTWFIRIVLSGVLVATFGLGTVNVVSYWQFRRAWDVAERLSEDELRQIASACAEAEKDGHQRMGAKEVPAALRKLRPSSVSFYPGSSDIRLYEIAEDGIWMRVNTSKDNQQIVLISSLFVPQRQVALWHKDRNLAQRLEPAGRIITISEYRMHATREWIMLPAEIRVIDRPHQVDGSDAVAASVSLTTETRNRITAAIARLPAGMRGRHFTSGALDGVSLRLQS